MKIDIESCRKIRNQKACRGERTDRILNRSENCSSTENLESRLNNGCIIKGIFVYGIEWPFEFCIEQICF
jgi:hypothetical protein